MLEPSANVPNSSPQTSLNLREAKVIDLEIVSEGPTDSEAGSVIWATVEIYYSAAFGLSPELKIKVPVLGGIGLDVQEIRAQAIAAARTLIERACCISDFAPDPANKQLEANGILEPADDDLAFPMPTPESIRDAQLNE